MSTERDELAREVFVADNAGQSREASLQDWETFGPIDRAYAHTIADGLLADGWTKTRRITTAEELDALAFASVVLDDDGDVYRSGINNGETAWWQAGPQGMFRTVALPATVLWEPAPSA